MTYTSLMRGRVLRAVGAEALGQGLNIAVRLLLVPLFLYAWGAAAYGEWLILTAVAAGFGLADFGGQLYFVNRLTVEWAVGKHDVFQQVLSTGLAVFLISSVLPFVCVAVIGLTWPSAVGWLELKAVDDEVALRVLLIMALRFLIALPVGLYLGIYRATGAQATSVMSTNLMLIIQFVASAFALLAGAGMLVLAVLEVIPLLVVAALVCVDLRRRLPSGIKLFDLSKVDRSILRASISPSLHFLGIHLAMAVMIQGSVIAVAKALGPVEVAVFASMRTVSNLVSRFLAILSHSVWPEFTRLESTGQTQQLTRLYKLILIMTLLGGLTYLIGLQQFGEVFYHWWLNHQLPYDKAAMFLMACFVLITTLWTLGGNLLMATNAHQEYSRIQLPINAIALMLCYLGAVQHGLTGAVAGLIAGQSTLMLGAVVVILARKGWKQNSNYLLRISAWGLILLPASLNLWSGIAGIAAVGWLAYRQFTSQATMIEIVNGYQRNSASST